MWHKIDSVQQCQTQRNALLPAEQRAWSQGGEENGYNRRFGGTCPLRAFLLSLVQAGFLLALFSVLPQESSQSESSSGDPKKFCSTK